MSMMFAFLQMGDRLPIFAIQDLSPTNYGWSMLMVPIIMLLPARQICLPPIQVYLLTCLLVSAFSSLIGVPDHTSYFITPGRCSRVPGWVDSMTFIWSIRIHWSRPHSSLPEMAGVLFSLQTVVG